MVHSGRVGIDQGLSHLTRPSRKGIHGGHFRFEHKNALFSLLTIPPFSDLSSRMTLLPISRDANKPQHQLAATPISRNAQDSTSSWLWTRL